MQAIGEAAGLSRAAPAYFFGSKSRLYDAVLARVIERARTAMKTAYAGIHPALDVSETTAFYVGAMLDFLASDYAFLRLVQREALAGAPRVAELFGQPVHEALAAFAPAAERAGVSAERLLLDVVALCWYPFAHEHTLLPALNMKPRDPGFLEAHKRHITDLVVNLTLHRPLG
jgi:AcrR family transcriptional regulator